MTAAHFGIPRGNVFASRLRGKLSQLHAFSLGSVLSKKPKAGDWLESGLHEGGKRPKAAFQNVLGVALLTPSLVLRLLLNLCKTVPGSNILLISFLSPWPGESVFWCLQPIMLTDTTESRYLKWIKMEILC